MNITGHTSRNLPIKPLPVAPEDIAAHARIERALAVIREDYKSAAVTRMGTTGGERAAWTAYMDTLLDLRNVLEVRR